MCGVPDHLDTVEPQQNALPLWHGVHQVEVKSKDVYNNSSFLLLRFMYVRHATRLLKEGVRLLHIGMTSFLCRQCRSVFKVSDIS